VLGKEVLMAGANRLRWGVLAVGAIVIMAISVMAQSPTPGGRFGDPAGALRDGAGQLDGLPGAGVSNLPIEQAANYERQATGMLSAAQSYLAAVTASTQQTATYLSETPAYIAACADAPWSCAAYVYEAVTGTYLDNSAVSLAPLNEATLDRAALDSAQPLTVGDPAPSAAAYQAISLFAHARTGATVAPLYAGTLTEDVQRVIGYLPDEITALTAALTGSADAAYWGLWAGGAGAVLFGECSDAAACAVSGANAFPTSDASNEAGVLTTFSLETMPTEVNGALTVLTQVYPALRGLPFTHLTDISEGFAFRAITGETGYPESPGIMTMGIIGGVVDVQGRTLVYIVLAGTTVQADMPDSPFN
jgi:hypothetical protein